MLTFFSSLFFLIFPFLSPPAIVLPHHDLVKTERQTFLEEVKLKKPFLDTIILVGPDHFSSYQKGLYYSNQSWQLSDSTLSFASSLEEDLSPFMVENTSLIKNDHAIYNLVSELHSTWPKAKIFPFLIGQEVELSSLDSLSSTISSRCKNNCLLVASVDFSHYLPTTLAQAHDSYTLSQLQNQNLLAFDNIEVDSPQSLYLFVKHSQSRGAKKWHLSSHTNSGLIFNNPDTETTTHIMGYYSKGRSAPSQTMVNLRLPYQIDPQENQSSLGPRFFYGTNFLNTDSTLPDFAIVTTETPTSITKAFLPISNNNGLVNFLRGPEKHLRLQELFDTIQPDFCLTKDYFWGTLIYDRKCNSSTRTN